MPTLTPKPSAPRTSVKKRPSRPSKKIKRAFRRLRYYSHDEKKWLRHETIRLFPVATSLPKLEPEVYRILKREIVREDGTVHLTTRIIVTRDGRIVDGRHRARILVEAGYGKQLYEEIEARRGDWVEQLPDGEDPFIYAAKAQMARRNCPRWRIAWSIIPAYLEAVEQGNLQRGKAGLEKGGKSPVKTFCDKAGFSKAVFSQVARVQRTASPEDIAAVEAGTVSLNAIIQKLDAEKKSRKEGCSAEEPRHGERSADSRTSRTTGGAKSGEHAKATGNRKKCRSLKAERKHAVQVVNELLSASHEDAAATNARILFASLDPGPRQRITQAVHEAESERMAGVGAS